MVHISLRGTPISHLFENPFIPEPPPEGSTTVIPPRGFKAEQYPLRHRLIYACALGMNNDNQNTVFMPIVHGSSDMDVEPDTIQVNPHNTAYEEDTGALCRQMSILDRLTISLKFNMLQGCDIIHETAAGVFSGDDIPVLNFLWRPIFGSFDGKLNAADDDTSVTVAAMLGMTVDATNEDVVPITTNKLDVGGASDTAHPISNVNAVQVFGDFNYTTNTTMEDHVHDETLLQAMLRRSTVKGALRSFMGRTRHVTLSRNRMFQNVYIDKFMPTAIRRIVPFSFMGIQVHLPTDDDISQQYGTTAVALAAHLGIKMIVNYHEWNPEHDQDMGSQV